jgi:hypothetical protein
VRYVQQQLAVSERRACRVLGQPRSTQRRRLVVRDDEGALTQAIVDLASELAVTAIGASLRYPVIKAGTSITGVWSASGVARG